MPPNALQMKGGSGRVPYGLASHLRTWLGTCDHLRSGISQVIASTSHISICPLTITVKPQISTKSIQRRPLKPSTCSALCIMFFSACHRHRRPLCCIQDIGTLLVLVHIVIILSSPMTLYHQLMVQTTCGV